MLAVVIVSCDRYSWFWPTWYKYFDKNFGFFYPVYLINESKPADMYGVTQILSPVEGVHEWTKMLRNAINQIPSDEFLILMDDFLIVRDMRFEIDVFYEYFGITQADALRVMADKNKHCKLLSTEWDDVSELTSDSEYRTSFSPNFWQRAYLEQCIAVDESPWDCELNRNIPGKVVYMEYPGWYVPALWNGVVLPNAKKYM